MKPSREITEVLIEEEMIKVTYSGRVLSMPLRRINDSLVGHEVSRVYVDEELANEAVTIVTSNGCEESVHVDAFLEYCHDPDYFRDLALYEATLLLIEKFNDSGLRKGQLAKALGTSMSQIGRVFDSGSKAKTIDQVAKCLSLTGWKLNLSVEKIAVESAKIESSPFKYIEESDLKEEETKFRPLRLISCG